MARVCERGWHVVGVSDTWVVEVVWMVRERMSESIVCSERIRELDWCVDAFAGGGYACSGV